MNLDRFLSDLGIDVSAYSGDAESPLLNAETPLLLDKSDTSVSGQADIVFVIDTTGSMENEIAGVVANVTSFAESLANNYNAVANYAVIEYKDLDEDGDDSTRVIKNGSSNWFNNVGAFANKVNELTANGGGDDPECAIDALELARRLDFRINASKFVILITDADYKVLNHYGINSLEEEAQLLKDNGIITSVVTADDLREVYQDILETTGGIYANIDESFSNVLLQLSDKIGEKTSDGMWAILSHGYRYVKIPANSDGDYDDDNLSDDYELGSRRTINLSALIAARLFMSGVPFELYHGKTSIDVYDALSDPTRDDTDGDGIVDDKDTAPWNKGLADGIIGAVKICSYGTGPSSSGNFDGHAFVAYTSFIDDDLTLYGILVSSSDDTAKQGDSRSDRPSYHEVKLSSDSVITIGGWAGWLPDELKGTWINNELMVFAGSIPSQQRSLMKYLKVADVEKFTALTKNNSKWTYLYNCSAYAVDFWNAVTGDNLSARGALIYRNPSSLSYNIEKRSGYKIGDALKAVWP